MGRRRSKATPKKRREFLEILAESGNVSLSAEALNLSRQELYRIRDAEEDFATAWDEAMACAADVLEAEARRRAIDGLERKQFTKGGAPIIDPATGEQYVERAYSDTLLIFLMKGANPEKYRERSSTELTGPGGSPLPAANVVVYLPSNGRDESAGETQ